MTDKLDEILRPYIEKLLRVTEAAMEGDVYDEPNPNDISLKEAILAWHKAELERIIGEDERHDNGQIMVNDPSLCMDCTNPDERFARNKLRAEQRRRAGL